MTIYHRLKVWAIKGYRFFRYGFKQIRQRSTNAIFLTTVKGECDYCHDEWTDVAALECEWEVVALICEKCTEKVLAVFK